MATANLLALIDDIATLLDDIAVLSKVAAKKTAGVLGDDLALSAEQMTGIKAQRELPVVWAVAKGSFKNKLILIPAALAISAVAPWAVTLLLMIGGLFLCYEGFEKLAHKFGGGQGDGGDSDHHREQLVAISDPQVDLVALEQVKIKGAIRTDFILSAEIIIITLGSVKDATFGTQVAVLCGLGVLFTVGVYGLVAGIVKLDDAGLYLLKSAPSGFRHQLGKLLLRSAPVLMKVLSVVGTAAMFLVGGSILLHGLPFTHHGIETILQWVSALPALGTVLAALTPILLDGLTGLIAGALALIGVSLASRLKS